MSELLRKRLAEVGSPRCGNLRVRQCCSPFPELVRGYVQKKRMSGPESIILRKMPGFSFAMNGELYRFNKTIFPRIRMPFALRYLNTRRATKNPPANAPPKTPISTTVSKSSCAWPTTTSWEPNMPPVRRCQSTMRMLTFKVLEQDKLQNQHVAHGLEATFTTRPTRKPIRKPWVMFSASKEGMSMLEGW